jgi:lipopolysaccharide export system protein LptC
MAERIQRFLLWVLAIGLVVGTAAALRYATGYRHVAGLGAPPPSLPPDVYLRLSGITVTGRKDGRAAWVVTADRIDSTRNRERVEFVGNIRAQLLQNGQPRATLRAEKATLSEVTKILTAEGRPGGKLTGVVRGADAAPGRELTFETGQLTWNIGSRQILCPGPVRLAVKGMTLEGVQLAVDLNTKRFSLNEWNGTFPVGEDFSPGETVESLRELAR